MTDQAIKVSKELENIARMLDAVVAEVAGERVSFCLVVATTAAQGGSDVQYVSNTDRSSGVAMLEVLLQRWRDGLPDVPQHSKH